MRFKTFLVRMVACTALICHCNGLDAQNPKADEVAGSDSLKSLRTVAEQSNYQATAREQEVLDFLSAIDQASPYASQVQIGKTTEDRPIQALILAREPKVELPLPVKDDRIVIVLLGGIHSGENDGKEALLALARDLLADASPKYLDRAVLIFIPNFNADGNERIGPLHRPGQDGPDRGMGTRENAVGLDLNRDFMKLDSPEVRSLVRMLDAWDVDVLIDTHTTNGSLHQYDLTYDVPHNPAANQPMVQWLRNDMLPQITKDLLAQGFPTFYYGNFSQDHKRWESFGHEPRYSTEYMGLRGKMGILVESYSYTSYQRRIDASYLFIDACLKQITENAKQVNTLLGLSKADPNPEKTKAIIIQAKVVEDSSPAVAKGFSWSKKSSNSATAPKPGDATVEEDDDHEHSVAIEPNKSEFPTPKDRNRKSEMVPTDFEVKLVNVGAGVLSIDAPEYYFVPADNAWAASRLRMHGIELTWFDPAYAGTLKPTAATQYRLTSVKELPEFQKHRLKKADVTAEKVQWQPVAGWLVSPRQKLGTLGCYLLEPHSDDSLAVWNFFDPSLKPNSVYPVLRIDTKLSVPAPMRPLGLLESPAPQMSQEELSLAKIYNPDHRVSFVTPPAPFPKWLSNQEAYLVQHNGKWHSVDCKSGAMQPFDRPKRLVDALSRLEAFGGGKANNYLNQIDGFDADLEHALIENKNDLYLFRAGNNAIADQAKDTVRQLTHSPDKTKELAEISPTGRHVVFVQSNNLWVVDCESTEVRKLTDDTDSEVLNGKLDWVYQEEIYGRGKFKAYWWSTDGTMVAYLRLDETPVPRFGINNSLSFAQTLEETRYPKSGQANPIVTLHVVHVENGKHVEVPLDEYAPTDRLVVRVGWRPGFTNELIYQVQNRIQTKLDLCSFDTVTKKSRKIVQETSPAWVDVIDEPHWLPDGSFLWLSDSLQGRRHISKISPDGKWSSVTEGDWDVKSIDWVSADGKQVWISAHRSARTELNVLKIDLETNNAEMMGEKTGSHRISVHPSGNYYFDAWSDVSTAGQTWLRKHDGGKIRTSGGYRSDRWDYVKSGTVELFEISARDGFSMQSLLYKPSNFEQRRSGSKMPVLIHVYGGPSAPTVENTRNHRYDLWHRFLAEQGICVLLCDNRSALGRGNTDTWKIYKDLGSTELRDLEDAVGWLKQQAWVDADRIGLWGWSYGGYFTGYAMTHSGLFRAGISGAPVTDWNNYDSIYTERYMDTPAANPDGYRSSSVVAAANNLQGRLMLIHGEIDDNVHLANTMQLVHALQKANKKFDLMVYPSNRHGITDPEQTNHQFQIMTDFLMQYLVR